VVSNKILKALSFDDVMLVPKLSTIEHRNGIDISTNVASIPLNIPIIAANMSSVCEANMASKLGNFGGLGIIHRMCTKEQQCAMLQYVKTITKSGCFVGMSFGIDEYCLERVGCCKDFSDINCLDVAHAHHSKVREIVGKYILRFETPLIIGNIATAEAAEFFLSIIPREWESKIALKASIGGGSLCTTRIKTGFGMPTLQAILDISEVVSCTDITLIADGGIKNSGDIVKALAAGANAVMVGKLLAGTAETPGNVIKAGDGNLYKIYRGSASYGDKKLRQEETSHIEGDETLVPYSGSVAEILSGLKDGIRSGFSYSGATNIDQLQMNAEFIEISTRGYNESLPHGK
jgi:IMP dehydrogenase